MSRSTFKLTLPDVVTAPVVVASPHSGRVYDWDFLSTTVLDAAGIRSSEDAYVDLLLDRVTSLGVPLLTAEMPRAFLDLNRAPEELDPAVVQGVPRGAMNPRISSGLGVIPRVVAQGRAIYRGKISQDEAAKRIETVWRPYHACLTDLMNSAHDQFGRAILLDIHSMPHEAIEGAGPRGRTPEIVLGDRFGASASGDLVGALESIFVDLGFRVARNAPFAGAYVTQAYGKPARGRHAIQIEIDRALYLDEGQVQPNDNFGNLQDMLTEAISRFCATLDTSRSLAAE
ncbi:N-formylglutamate amidohydrolase [Jannaschia pohangensis]|uniref:N-formylglutamate amidohydrolase n=1 Tax=Jannaschia pohangensis TaxID=390807 RepID=A0A1I3PZP6_9RHOB|nr:N-formylglutamate amidohydrolase [Jannaschia pohangensis]SFJ27083.1 N-formylglutamate amidohydrolase [Jannaschia pohangensis]